MSVFRENWLYPDAGLYVRFRPVPEGEQAPILAEVRRDGDAWVPRVMPDPEPICDPAPLVQCMDAVEERLAELDLVREVRDLCADAVSGCRYDGEDGDDLPDAGDDVRSLDPGDLLARVRARREVLAEPGHVSERTPNPGTR